MKMQSQQEKNLMKKWLIFKFLQGLKSIDDLYQKWIFQQQTISIKEKTSRLMETYYFQTIFIKLAQVITILILFSIAKIMSQKAQTRQNSQTGLPSAERQVFYMSHGIRKRKIFYNVQYTEEEDNWIKTVRQELQRKKGIHIEQRQTLLRYYYSTQLNLEKCVQKLQKYHKWFTNPNIQNLSKQAENLISKGFAYSYGKAKDGRAFILMNLSLMDPEIYSIDHCYQAINFTLNRVIKEQFVLGYIQTYYYIIDVNQQLLSLPLGTIGEISTAFGDAYSMRLQKMFIINMTTLGKWLYNRVSSFLSEETVNKISLFTKKQVTQGCLRQSIDVDVIEKKYGGFRHNINYQKLLKKQKEHTIDQVSESQYFSIEQVEEYNYYTQKVCCGGADQCKIY